MFAVDLDTSNELAQALLTHYSFDLGGYSPSELIARWQNQYPINWLHLAIIEALYQGRYKAISVQQILVLWQRREQATFHFNVEFENLVCSRFPEIFTVRPNISTRSKLKHNNQRQQTYLSPVYVVENNSKSSTNNDVQINSGEEQKKQEQTEEIPSFLHLARRHRQPILESADNKINSYRSNPHTESNSTFIEKPISNSTDKSLSSSAIGQSATAVATPTYTALASSNNVAPVSTMLAEKQLSHLETFKINHPPIDQFIPENCDRSNSFTSKLKAISTHKVTDGENCK